jgi:hypothetical protein
MDFANRGNRPTQTPQQPAGFQNDQPTAPSFQPNNGGKKKLGKPDLSKAASGLLFVGLVVLVVALLIGLVFGGSSQSKETDLIKTDKYQAVFLDSQDGQVYFGKLDVYNQDLYVLTDIYYVRVEQPIQPEGVNQPSQPNISLAKLGNELHGPEDVMYIARDKVLYWENLKDDGQVVTAINEFKANGGQPTNNNQQQNTQQNSGANGTQPAGADQQNDTPAGGTPTTQQP